MQFFAVVPIILAVVCVGRSPSVLYAPQASTLLQFGTTTLKVAALMMVSVVGLIWLANDAGDATKPAHQNFQKPFEGSSKILHCPRLTAPKFTHCPPFRQPG